MAETIFYILTILAGLMCIVMKINHKIKYAEIIVSIAFKVGGAYMIAFSIFKFLIKINF